MMLGSFWRPMPSIWWGTKMKWAVPGSWWGVSLVVLCAVADLGSANEPDRQLARKAQEVLKNSCYRCHGQDGAVEGGLNYVMDRDKLVARKKLIPGSAEQSPLYRRVASGKMPPPDETPRPSVADVALLKQWIEAGAVTPTPPVQRTSLTDADIHSAILADLESMEKRSRRFQRYFTITHLWNQGLGDDELRTYRHALDKLLNSLSWHPRITRAQPIDPGQTVLRIDLRDFMWDANLWNRILSEYPYGVLRDTALARAVSVITASKLPLVRADWFIATACRPPLYHDLLQLPTNLAELERQLRVDPAVNIQQDRVARAGFNGSGIAKNNRIVERHDAVHGAYWRSYDFEAVPQNLIERDLLLPDRRNVFAYPLGPGFTDNTFQHAAGEVIFNLPNGLHAYMLVNANNLRADKGPTAIVSDPKRPDRAVENGISCISCHYRGINPKDDQVREFVQKNPKAFSRADAEVIQALYVPQTKMRALMDQDAERFRKAVEQTGNRITAFEPITTMTLRYEADVDLATAAAEAGSKPDEFLDRVVRTENLARNLGSLKAAGGTVHRQVFIQSFGDIVRELRLGVAFQPALIAQSLPDNTGELDPLEGLSSSANSIDFTRDGRRALFASADRTVRLWDVEANREVRRFVGHTASVWSVAFSPDGKRALSGSADRTVRLWDVETGQEVHRLGNHTELVTCVTFSPDGRRALSGSYDRTVELHDLEKGQTLATFRDLARYVNAVAFAPDGRRAAVCGENRIHLIDTTTGQTIRRLEGHTAAVLAVAFSPDGQQVLSGSDDQSARLWDAGPVPASGRGQHTPTGKSLRTLAGHLGAVRSVAFSSDGKQVLTGGADSTVRLWDRATGQETRRFRKHTQAVLRAVFLPDGQATLSGSQDSVVQFWSLVQARPAIPPPNNVDVPALPGQAALKPRAVIPVDGPLSSLILSPNGKWLWFLNAAESKLGRVDTTTLKRDRELSLTPGTEVLALTLDGQTLYSLAPAIPAVSGLPVEKISRLQVIDPLQMVVRKTLPIPVSVYDLAVADSGRVYLSGAPVSALASGRYAPKAEWTAITVLDVAKEKVVASWGGVWSRSFIRLAPDQGRVYVSTQGVTPGSLETMVLPASLDEKPVLYASPARSEHSLGGSFLVTPDGKFLLSKTGTVLRLSASKAADLAFAVSIHPFLDAVVAPELRAALVLTAAGNMEHYSYPEFQLRGSYGLTGAAYRMAFDAQRGRLYVVVLDLKSLSDRPGTSGPGSLQVYDLADLLVEPR